MEDMISFCDRAIKETSQIGPNQRYAQTTVRKEWMNMRRHKKQIKWSINEKNPTSMKIQKFNNLKYKPKAQIIAAITE